MIPRKTIDLCRVLPGMQASLAHRDTGWARTKELKELGKRAIKKRAQDELRKSLQQLTAVQELLYADNRYSVLMVLQALDAAGKDDLLHLSGITCR